METKNDFDRLKSIYKQPRLHLSNHFDAIKNKIDIAFCQKETSDDDEAKKWKFLFGWQSGQGGQSGQRLAKVGGQRLAKRATFRMAL